MPLEYLERLLLQNSVFGDELRLEGVSRDPEGTVILTSQPHISGGEASRDEIVNCMSEHWFKPLRGLQPGKPGSLAFYRDLDEVAAFDAHPGKFRKGHSGSSSADRSDTATN